MPTDQSAAEESDAVTAVGQLDLRTLVQRAQDGDLGSFEALVDRFQTRLFRFALRIVHSRGEAEEIVQDTLITAWRRLPDLLDPTAFTRWIYQIATRAALDRLRARDRRPAVALDPDLLESEAVTRIGSSPAGDPALASEQRALVRTLEREIAALPDDLRISWVLMTYHEMSYAEIAQIVAAPESTVRGRIARARRKLAEGMTAWR